MIYNTVELNQFKRTKDKLSELLDQLNGKHIADFKTTRRIQLLEMSIKALDEKMEEYFSR